MSVTEHATSSPTGGVLLGRTLVRFFKSPWHVHCPRLVLLSCAWGLLMSAGCSSSDSEALDEGGGSGGGSAVSESGGTSSSDGVGAAGNGSGGSSNGDFGDEGTGGSGSEPRSEGLPWDGQWSGETVATPGADIHGVRIATAQNGDSIVAWSRAEFVEFEVFDDFFETVDWPRNAPTDEPEFLFECALYEFDLIANEQDDVLIHCGSGVGYRPSGGSWLTENRDLSDASYAHTNSFIGWSAGFVSLSDEGVWSEPVDVFPGYSGNITAVALGSDQTVAFSESSYSLFDGTDWSAPIALPDGIKPTYALRSGDGAFVYSWLDSSTASTITASYFSPGEGFSPPTSVRFSGKSWSFVAAASNDGTLFAAVDRHAVLFTVESGWHEELAVPFLGPRIAVDADGNAVVSWISNGFDGDDYDGLYVHRYINEAGWTREEQINQTWRQGYNYDIAAGPDGLFSLVYMTSQSRIEGYRFLPD